MQDIRLLEELQQVETCDELLNLEEEVADLQKAFNLNPGELNETCTVKTALIRSHTNSAPKIIIKRGHRLISA